MGFRSGSNTGLDPGGLKVAGLGVSVPSDGLRHRYRASDITLADGDTVSTWPDAAGTQDLTAPTGNEPDYIEASTAVNGQPAVRFDGSNSEYLSHSDTPHTGSADRTTVVMLELPNNNEHFVGIMGSGAEGQWWGMDNASGTDFRMHIYGGDFDANFSFSSPEAVMATYDGSTVETFCGTSGAGATNADSLNTNSADYVVGAGLTDSSYFTGDIAEVLEYTRKLDSNERAQVFKYSSVIYDTH